jgi:hypothetical protein
LSGRVRATGLVLTTTTRRLLCAVLSVLCLLLLAGGAHASADGSPAIASTTVGIACDSAALQLATGVDGRVPSLASRLQQVPDLRPRGIARPHRGSADTYDLRPQRPALHAPAALREADGASLAVWGDAVLRLETGVAAEGALPSALTLGRNAEVGVDVYKGVRSGKDVYVGITNNLMRRGAEHGDRFALERLTATSVTRGEARAIEQAMIVRNPGFQNARNSISPNHAWYDDAVSWGESWLQRAGL